MIDEFRFGPTEPPFDPLSVVLFKALQVVAFFFFIALIAISAQKSKGKADSKAEFLISLSWPDSHPDDFDLFVEDPLQNVAWYRRRDIGFMALERDNRGNANDFIVVNGKKTYSPTRQEVVSLRGIIAGEYIVNAYHFVAKTGLPVPVTVTVEKLNPALTIVARETMDMAEGGEERTGVRFTLDDKGNVSKISRTNRSIIEELFRSTLVGVQ